MFGKTYRQFQEEDRRRKALLRGIGCGLLIVACGVGVVYAVGWVALKAFGG